MNFSHTVSAVSTYLSDALMQVILVSKVLAKACLPQIIYKLSLNETNIYLMYICSI